MIERATILARGPLLKLATRLDPRLRHQTPPGPVALEPVACLKAMERAYILQVLERTRWVIEGEQGAAAILDLNPSTFGARGCRNSISASPGRGLKPYYASQPSVLAIPRCIADVRLLGTDRVISTILRIVDA